MTAGEWICMSLMLTAAMLMAAIGIFQWKSDRPARISTGEPIIAPKELTDVRAWNMKHGLMWITYGMIIAAALVVSLCMNENTLSGIVMMAGCLLPLPAIPLYHNYLLKKYHR